MIVGKGGGGKTVTSILLALRFLAQGGRIYITDRSSTPDDRGATGGTGHYDTLLSLIPGARRVQLGTPHGAVICPWDVPDVEHIPDQKIEFLLALHALLDRRRPRLRRARADPRRRRGSAASRRDQQRLPPLRASTTSGRASSC